MSRLGLSLLAVAFALGLWLAAIAGPMVIWLGLAGIAIGVLYSLPRIYLSGKGLGELAVFIAFGPLPVCGAAWLQDGVWDLGRLLISLPVGLWTAAILLINEVPDLESDAAAGKRTLVVRFGVGGAKATYLAMHAIGCAGTIAAVAVGALPAWFAAAAVALLALGVKAGLGIASVTEKREQLQKSIETTLAIQAIGSLALIATIVLAG